MRIHRLAPVVAIALVVGSAVPVLAADPVERTVTITDDVSDAGDGETSLREAVEEAETAGGGYLIHLPAGTYTLDSQLSVDDVDTEIALRGAGAATTTIDAQQASRVLMARDARLAFEDLAITGGQVIDGPGGAMLVNDTHLRLERVRVHDNSLRTSAVAATFTGGALAMATDDGTSHLEVTDSVFEKNAAVAETDTASGLYGGAIALAKATTFHITGSRFHGNAVVAHPSTQTVMGGALSVSNLTDVSGVLDDSTFDANELVLPPGHSGWAQGAALGFNDNNADGVAAEIRSTNLTLEGNGSSAPDSATVYANNGPLVVAFEHLTLRSDGIGLYNGPNVVELANSVIDTVGYACTSGDPRSQGGNVVSDALCGTDEPSDSTDVDPGLGAFDTTTSPVPVVRLLPASIAVDHGILDDVDQDARGEPRPGGAAPDAGAFEHQGPTAEEDAIGTTADTPVAIAVLANDTAGDAPLAPGSVSVSPTPGSGTATAATDGTITFTPGGTGVATFGYQVCQQGFSLCDTATVTVTVDPVDDPTDPPEPTPPTDPTDPGDGGSDEQDVVRRSGQDRYETAVLASRAAFEPGVPVAYVATGETFPDALAGAPLAARDGAPILLTRPDVLPPTTATELSRLAPGRIVVLGGTAAVSTAVELELAGLTTGPVTRLYGPDRYATAARIAEAFTAPGGTVYLATALDFPDALAGAAAAGRDGAPILLVSPSELPAATATQLTRLDPTEVRVLGGTSVVPTAVLQAVEDHVGTPAVRLSGPDRYATAAAVSGTFDAAETVYVATGLDFPDALAGAPIAGAEPAPILLTAPDTLPAVAAAELERLAPDQVVILGGEGAVSVAVAAALGEHSR